MISQTRLANNLKKIRQAKGLSQEKLAELAGIHRTYVGLIERSQRNINLNTLDRIATALQVGVVELLQGELYGLAIMTKVGLFIGAGKKHGVGAASAKCFAQNGYNIALNFLKSHESALAVAEECKAYNVKAELFQGDASNPAEIQQVIANVIEHFGRLDSVVYCAGATTFASYDNLNALSMDDFNRLFAVNCFGVYLAAASSKEALIASRGSFIAVSSAAGITGIGSSIAYATSKGALNTLVLSLSKALAPHVRVNAVAPSFIDSSWWEERFRSNSDKYTEFKKSMADKTALGEVITPHDVAQAIYYLAENRITGEVLRLDAGAHVK